MNRWYWADIQSCQHHQHYSSKNSSSSLKNKNKQLVTEQHSSHICFLFERQDSHLSFKSFPNWVVFYLRFFFLFILFHFNWANWWFSTQTYEVVSMEATAVVQILKCIKTWLGLTCSKTTTTTITDLNQSSVLLFLQNADK